MTVTVTFLVVFFVGYVIFKGFLFYRLNVALRKLGDKQKAIKGLTSFDMTRRRDDSSGPPRAIEL